MIRWVVFFFMMIVFPAGAMAQDCVKCHKKITPNIVKDWQLSAHSKKDVSCAECHGDGHKGSDDVDKVELPTAATCGTCHEDRREQFSKGKHALAWAAMNAMPTTHQLPMALTTGMKGCGGCHKIGLKTEEEIQALKADGSAGFGVAS